jgi:hypothetical protein
MEAGDNLCCLVYIMLTSIPLKLPNKNRWPVKRKRRYMEAGNNLCCLVYIMLTSIPLKLPNENTWLVKKKRRYMEAGDNLYVLSVCIMLTSIFLDGWHVLSVHGFKLIKLSTG